MFIEIFFIFIIRSQSLFSKRGIRSEIVLLYVYNYDTYIYDTYKISLLMERILAAIIITKMYVYYIHHYLYLQKAYHKSNLHFEIYNVISAIQFHVLYTLFSCMSCLLCVPSQKGRFDVCLQLHSQYSLVSETVKRMGLSFILRKMSLCVPSQNGWFLLCPHRHQE